MKRKDKDQCYVFIESDTDVHVCAIMYSLCHRDVIF